MVSCTVSQQHSLLDRTHQHFLIRCLENNVCILILREKLYQWTLIATLVGGSMNVNVICSVTFVQIGILLDELFVH